MAIQNRRGAYADFDPQKLVPGEWAVVQSGDPNSERGKAVYMAFEVGDVERMATYEDMLENIDQATSDIQTQFTNELTQTITNANSAVSDMQDDIDAEIQSASTAVSTLTAQVNTAIASANTATTNANTATNRATDAVDAIQAIIDSDTAVLSWNGRAGEVEPQAGDYTSAQPGASLPLPEQLFAESERSGPYIPVGSVCRGLCGLLLRPETGQERDRQQRSGQHRGNQQGSPSYSYK